MRQIALPVTQAGLFGDLALRCNVSGSVLTFAAGAAIILPVARHRVDADATRRDNQ